MFPGRNLVIASGSKQAEYFSVVKAMKNKDIGTSRIEIEALGGRHGAVIFMKMLDRKLLQLC